MPFTTRNDLLVRTRDGHNAQLAEEIRFRDARGVLFRGPEGAWSDGASAPRELWGQLPPFGQYWLAAVLHDLAYRGTLQRLNQTTLQWEPANLTKDEADALFLEAMGDLGVNEAAKHMLYEGVRLLGYRAFRDDREEVAS